MAGLFLSRAIMSSITCRCFCSTTSSKFSFLYTMCNFCKFEQSDSAKSCTTKGYPFSHPRIGYICTCTINDSITFVGPQLWTLQWPQCPPGCTAAGTAQSRDSGRSWWPPHSATSTGICPSAVEQHLYPYLESIIIRYTRIIIVFCSIKIIIYNTPLHVSEHV